MSRSTKAAEYQALAQFRFLIRQYLNNTEKVARSVGLEPQQYVGMLALRGLPSDEEPTIAAWPSGCKSSTTAPWNWWTAWRSGGFSAANAPRKTAARCTCS
jgi:hypothetical protein